MGKSFILFLSFLLFQLNAQAQDSMQVVQGTVTDAKSGMPIPGANVIQQGTSNGVITNFDGEFTIEVPADAVLVFSYLGYATQEVAVSGQVELNISLEPEASALDEVVVVGYGSQSKETLTGAVTEITSEVLQDRPISTVSEGLQGAVGNLNISRTGGGGAPNSTLSLNIRGYTGLGQANGPLIVIDGIQGGDINSINPNDIESISVVKDAASAAIYGSSAANGVIIITTKDGIKGAGPTISINSNFSGAQPIGLPNMLNSITFARLYNEAQENAGRSPFFSEDAIERMIAYQNGEFDQTTIANPAPGANRWLDWGGANANNDWFDIYFKDLSLSQQHNVSVSGGSENTSYYMGGGYNEREGLYKFGKDIFKRYNFRINLSTEITDWLTANVRSSYAKELFNTPTFGGGRTGNNWMHQLGRKHPNIPIRNPDGGYAETSDIIFHEEGGRYKTYNDQPVITGELEFALAKGWDATVNYTYRAGFYQETDHKKTLFHTLPNGEQAKIDWTYPNGFSRYASKSIEQVINAFTSYQLGFDEHNFKILGGYVQVSDDFTAFSASNSNLYSNEIPSLNLTYGTTPSVDDNIRTLKTRGFFGRFNYDYNEKYLLTITGRYDGTSKFLEDVRWKLYPGISVGWNVHKESFWGDNSFFNTLKLRGSYGSLGDQSLSAFGDDLNRRTYPFYPSLGTSSPNGTNWIFNDGREAAVYPPNLIDPTLTWITTTTLDFGFDATFFDRRLSATFDWYRRSVDDYIGPAQSLPAVLGTGVPPTNSAAIETTGFELSMEWRDYVGEDFEYGVRAILSDYTGRVVEFPNPENLITNWYEGEEMGNIWGYVTDRYFTSEEDYANSPDQSMIYGDWGAGDIKYVDLNGDGQIGWGDNTLENPGDRKIIGNSTPRYSYSVLADATWKNFDLSIFVQGVGKRDVWMGGNYFFGITGSVWQSSPFQHHLDRWTPEMPNGYFPKFYMSGENSKNTQVQTKYLQSAAYTRIKNLQLGYSIPNSALDAMGVNRLRIYASVDNLATFSPLHEHSSLDPELSISDSKIYPLQRTYSIGVNLSF